MQTVFRLGKAPALHVEALPGLGRQGTEYPTCEAPVWAGLYLANAYPLSEKTVHSLQGLNRAEQSTRSIQRSWTVSLAGSKHCASSSPPLRASRHWEGSQSLLRSSKLPVTASRSSSVMGKSRSWTAGCRLPRYMHHLSYFVHQIVTVATDWCHLLAVSGPQLAGMLLLVKTPILPLTLQ